MNICLTCEKGFEPKRIRAKFCSDLCRATFHQIKKGMKDGKMTVRIYGIKNPITDKIFYIGKTVGLLEQRLLCHLKDTVNPKKIEILEEILGAGLNPEIVEIESIICGTEEDEIEALKRELFWINDFISKGVEICNKVGVECDFKPRLLAAFQRKSNKGANKSVRFNQKKFDLICSEEQLETPQEVMDFLVDKYWWEKKIGQYPTMVAQQAEEKAFAETHDVVMETSKGGITTTKGFMPTPDNATKIAELEKELANLPEKGGRITEMRRGFLVKEINKLK